MRVAVTTSASLGMIVVNGLFKWLFKSTEKYFQKSSPVAGSPDIRYVSIPFGSTGLAAFLQWYQDGKIVVHVVLIGTGVDDMPLGSERFLVVAHDHLFQAGEHDLEPIKERCGGWTRDASDCTGHRNGIHITWNRNRLFPVDYLRVPAYAQNVRMDRAPSHGMRGGYPKAGCSVAQRTLSSQLPPSRCSIWQQAQPCAVVAVVMVAVVPHCIYQRETTTVGEGGYNTFFLPQFRWRRQT